jgi:2-phosphoglycerate kinase
VNLNSLESLIYSITNVRTSYRSGLGSLLEDLDVSTSVRGRRHKNEYQRKTSEDHKKFGRLSEQVNDDAVSEDKDVKDNEILVYDTQLHSEENNQKVYELLSQFQAIRYSNNQSKEESGDQKVVETMLELISNYLDLNTFEVKDTQASSYLKFRKIFIKEGDKLTLVTHHKAIRSFLKFHSGGLFKNVPNIREMDVHTVMKQYPVLILIYGTSGSGKSTMSRRLSAMYGIPNVLSTDTVRKNMRTKIPKPENPLLHASTFETGDYLPESDYERIRQCLLANQPNPDEAKIDPEIMMEMSCVKGYEYQCEMIEPELIAEIDKICGTGQSLIVEGVHLSESVCNKLFAKYQFCIPFLIHVKDAEKHMQRFGSRCEGGSIDPEKNRYVKNFRYIRAIQKAIRQNPIDSKFMKATNDDAKKTLGLVSTCIRKYIKKFINLGSNAVKNLLSDRKKNILCDVFEKSVVQCNNKDEKDTASSELSIPKTKTSEQPQEEGLKWIYIKEKSVTKLDQYWFLRHEKLFHSRMKKIPLIPKVPKKRVKSAKKKNKFQTFSKLEAVSAKDLIRAKRKAKQHARSIFDAIRKYGKSKGTSTMVSESTGCTITKVNAN